MPDSAQSVKQQSKDNVYHPLRRGAVNWVRRGSPGGASTIGQLQLGIMAAVSGWGILMGRQPT